MRLGASTWGFFREPHASPLPCLPEVIQQIAAIDPLLGVEIWAAPTAAAPGPDPDQQAQITLACRHLPYVTVHTRPQYWHWSPQGLRQEIAFSKQLGAHRLVVHPSCLGLSTADDRPDWPEIRRIAGAARQAHVQLAVENVVDSMAVLDRILEEVGDDPSESNLGICLDVGHAALSSDAGRDSLANYVHRYAASLVHVHLHDNVGHADDHRVPGDGAIAWASLLDQLASVGYRGPAILEVQDPDRSPQEAVRRGVRLLRSLR